MRILEGADWDPQTSLLRARVLLRSERRPEAIQVLLAFAPPADPGLAAERHVLLGACYGVSRDFEAGLAELKRGANIERAPASVLDDARYFIALIEWMRHNNAQAEIELAPLRAHDDPNERARAHILQAWIEVGRQDIHKHVSSLVSALDAFEEAGARANVYHYARALSTLATQCREMPLRSIAGRIRRIAADFPWTPDLVADRANLLRAFGWLDALDGNAISAFRELKNAAAIAPTGTWRLLSMLDRAFLAQSTGEYSFADDQLNEAIEFERGMSWDDAGSDRIALLVLAQLVSHTDPAAAVVYLNRFRNLHADRTSLAPSNDARTNAFMSLSAGIARAALGDVEEAERLLQEAFSTFEAFSYEWRAALAAHHLFTVTGARKWHEIAKNLVRNYPNSWLAPMIRANDELIATGPRLTPAQRHVFDALCEGASTNAIAKRLGRSPHTVRNHISDIFEAFGVRSRAELLARLRTNPQA